MNAAGPQSNRSIESRDPEQRRSRVAEAREAAFFVNDKPVRVSEARPTVRNVIMAAGFEPAGCKVYRLSQQDDPVGVEVKDLDERLHATADKPIYLRCEKDAQRSPIASVAPGTAGGALGDINNPLAQGDIDNQATRPRDRAKDVGPGPPGAPPPPM